MPACYIREKKGYVKIGKIKIEGNKLGSLSNGGPAVVLRDCLYVPNLGKLCQLSVRKCHGNGLYMIF